MWATSSYLPDILHYHKDDRFVSNLWAPLAQHHFLSRKFLGLRFYPSFSKKASEVPSFIDYRGLYIDAAAWPRSSKIRCRARSALRKHLLNENCDQLDSAKFFKTTPGHLPTRCSDFVVETTNERLTLFRSFERGWSNAVPWQATATSGDVTVVRTSDSIINGTRYTWYRCESIRFVPGRFCINTLSSHKGQGWA